MKECRDEGEGVFVINAWVSTLVIRGSESKLVVFSANKGKTWNDLEIYWEGFHVKAGGSVNASHVMIAKASGIPNMEADFKRTSRHIFVLEPGSRAILDHVRILKNPRYLRSHINSS